MANPRTPVLCRPAFLWTLVALGAALRIFQYASDTSFWFDELSLVRNLVHRSAAQLATEPLRYDQVAPVGFLVAEKGISRVLGESDLAFRFLLLPIGLAALVLFVPLARRVLDGYAVPFAVAMFAIGAPFIRYCAEVKQYGIDIASVIVMSLLTLRLRDADSTRGRCIAAGLLGAVLVWFSQATILILAGLGGALLVAWLLERDARTARALRITVPIWAVACVAAALVALRLVSSATRAFMDHFWRIRGGFPPWPIQKTRGPPLALEPGDRAFRRRHAPEISVARALHGARRDRPDPSFSSPARRRARASRSVRGGRGRGGRAAVPVPSPPGALRRSRPRPGGRPGRGGDPSSRFAAAPRARRRVHGGDLRGPRMVAGSLPAPVLRRGSQDRPGVRARSPATRRRRVRLFLRDRGHRALWRRVRPGPRGLRDRPLLQGRSPDCSPRSRSLSRPASRLGHRRGRPAVPAAAPDPGAIPVDDRRSPGLDRRSGNEADRAGERDSLRPERPEAPRGGDRRDVPSGDSRPPAPRWRSRSTAANGSSRGHPTSNDVEGQPTLSPRAFPVPSAVTLGARGDRGGAAHLPVRLGHVALVRRALDRPQPGPPLRGVAGHRTAPLRPGRARGVHAGREGDQPRARGERPRVPLPAASRRPRGARDVPLSRAAAARRLRRALRGRDVRDRRSVHPLQRRGQVVRHRHGGGHRDVARDAAAA